MAWTARVWLALVVGLSCGCGSATGDNNGFGSGGGGGSGGFGATGGGGFGASGGASGGSGGGPASNCAAEAQFVYVIDSGGTLRKFDPPSLQFTTIGPVNCNTPIATPFSMAVDRNASAWVVFTNGRLYQVDTATAACTPTTFQAGQQGFMTFGMGFSSNGVGSTSDTLFVTNSDYSSATSGLGTIDTQSLMLTRIGAYDQISSRAEMTGTGDGRLFGAFEGTPYVVAEIDKTNAHIISQAPQTPIQYAPNSSNFAFAFWGGSFWLFVGPGSSTDVFQYDPAAGTTAQVSSETFAIVGAGVSTCAPLELPK